MSKNGSKPKTSGQPAGKAGSATGRGSAFSVSGGGFRGQTKTKNSGKSSC